VLELPVVLGLDRGLEPRVRAASTSVPSAGRTSLALQCEAVGTMIGTRDGRFAAMYLCLAYRMSLGNDSPT
jgi:hypothetical protein